MMALSSDDQYVPRKSNLFAPLHTIGLISDGSHVSFTPTTRGSGHLTISIGKSYYIMDLKKMKVLIRSPPFPNKITAIYGIQENTYVALDQQFVIIIQHNLQELGKLKGHTSQIRGMVAVGDYLVSWSDSEVLIWCLDLLTLHGKLPLPEAHPHIYRVIHPETYLNKMLVTFKDGGDVQLWNFKTLKLVHAFMSVKPDVTKSITSVCLTSHPDIIALGDSEGTLKLLDIQADCVLSQFQLSSTQMYATSLACITDKIGVEQGLVVAGCLNGDIVSWNTKEDKAASVLEGVHQGLNGVISLHALPEEPLVVTSGDDNSIIMWIFDGVSREPRELRSRKGMQGPPVFLDFYDDLGRDLLCVGVTPARLCDVSMTAVNGVIRCLRYSQRKALHTLTKTGLHRMHCLPTPTSVAFAYSRHYDWGNIVTTHDKQSSVYIWSGHDHSLLVRVLEYPKPAQYQQICKVSPPYATVVAVSCCGNFACVGYASGEMCLFGLQSGVSRGTFCHESSAHNGPVCQIEVSNSHEVVSASSAPNEMKLRTWDLRSRKFIKEMLLKEAAGQCVAVWKFKSFGALTAVVLTTDGNIKMPALQSAEEISNINHIQKVIVVDLQSQLIVRQFPLVMQDVVACIDFSKDGRWLLFSTLRQQHLYVYDIFSATLIDWIRFHSPALAFTIDPTSSYLYASLKNLGGGIAVFANTHIFDPSSSEVLLRSAPPEPIPIGDPILFVDSGDKAEEYKAPPNVTSMCQLEANQLTLSAESAGRIRAIIHLDKIKERNTPESALSVSNEAPFFLSSNLDYKAEESTAILSVESKIAKVETDTEAITLFGSSLKSLIRQHGKSLKKRNAEKMKKQRFKCANKVVEYLKTLSPSGIHLVLTELSNATSIELLSSMLDVFLDLAYNRNEVDFVQAILNVFLTIHGSELNEHMSGVNDKIVEIKVTNKFQQCPPSSIRGKLELLRELLEADWNPLNLSLHQAQCILKYLTHCQIE